MARTNLNGDAEEFRTGTSPPFKLMQPDGQVWGLLSTSTTAANPAKATHSYCKHFKSKGNYEDWSNVSILGAAGILSSDSPAPFLISPGWLQKHLQYPFFASFYFLGMDFCAPASLWEHNRLLRLTGKWLL